MVFWAWKKHQSLGDTWNMTLSAFRFLPLPKTNKVRTPKAVQSVGLFPGYLHAWNNWPPLLQKKARFTLKNIRTVPQPFWRVSFSLMYSPQSRFLRSDRSWSRTHERATWHPQKEINKWHFQKRFFVYRSHVFFQTLLSFHVCCSFPELLLDIVMGIH